ncbi:hypothetical protein M9458_013326 [Cirrhinus mrigala]|uniref:Ermin n=1 Tax=Cirrhinus mrigala TaxID=683832 RepID=A0ABD0QWL3_CIRMR
MEQNDKEAEKQQMNGQTEETMAPKELVNNSNKNEQEISENNVEKNEEEISGNNEEENAKEEEEEIEEEDDELVDDFQPSVEMSIRQFEKDENYRPMKTTRYNTVSYRKIKRGNTKQRIDEFESILDV